MKTVKIVSHSFGNLEIDIQQFVGGGEMSYYYYYYQSKHVQDLQVVCSKTDATLLE